MVSEIFDYENPYYRESPLSPISSYKAEQASQALFCIIILRCVYWINGKIWAYVKNTYCYVYFA